MSRIGRSAVLALLVLLAAIGSPSPAAEGSGKKLIVGSEVDFPPFALGQPGGTPDGFTVDLWKAVARGAKLDYTIRIAPFHQLLEDFRRGEIDVMINLAYSPERARFGDFSLPHVVEHAAVFVRRDDRRIRTEADLPDKSIIVVNGDFFHEHAAGMSWGGLAPVETAADAMKLLASGKHDAVLMAHLVGLQSLRDLGIGDVLSTVWLPEPRQKFAFAVRKGESALLAKINESLADIKVSGEFDRLYNKWFDALNPRRPSMAELAAYAIPALAVLSLVGLAWFSQRRLAQSLARSRASLRAMMDNLPHLVWLKDTHGCYIAANKSLARACGEPDAKAVIGKTDFDLYPKERAERYRAWHQEVMASRSQKLTEERVVENGAVRWLETHEIAVTDREGRLLGTTGVARDVTARKRALELLQGQRDVLQMIASGARLREVLERLIGVLEALGTFAIYCRETGIPDDSHRQVIDIATQTAAIAIERKRAEFELKLGTERLQETVSLLDATLESTADGILVLDSGRKVSRYNSRFLDMWRIPPAMAARGDDAELVRLVCEQVKDPRGFMALVEATPATSEDETFDIIELVDDRVYERYSRPQRLDGQVVGRVLSFRDITQRVRAESALRDRQQELERFSRLNLLRGMASGFAHELNQPLAAARYTLKGCMQFASSGRLEGKRAIELLSSAYSNVERVSEIFDRVAALSRRRSVELAAIHLEPLVGNILKLASFDRPADAVVVSTDLPADLPPIRADRVQIEQVMLNLLRNARESAASSGGAGRVSLGARALSDMVEVFVRDNGSGFSGEALERVFEPFFSTKEGGTGLGLSICQMIIEGLGGKITVEDNPEGGTTVRFTVPIATEQQEIYA